MNKRTLSSILFWCVAGLSALMLAGLGLALAGVLPVGPAAEPTVTETAELLEPEPTAGPTAGPTAEPTSATTTGKAPASPAADETTTTAPEEEPDRSTLVVLTATRGECWFSARLGSENGRVLDERVLAQGESARLEGERIWLTVGAAGNVDITVDGKPRTISPGTISLVLTGPGPASS